MNVTSVGRYRRDDKVAVWVCNDSKFLCRCLSMQMSEWPQRDPDPTNLCILSKESVFITDFYHEKDAFMLGFELANLFVMSTCASVNEVVHTCSSSAVYGSPLGPSSARFFEGLS